MILLAALATAAPALDGDPEGLGLGVLLGIPTGFSVAWRPGGPAWFDGAVAWSFENTSLALHADVLFTVVDKPPEESEGLHLPFWIGVGPRVRMGEGQDARNGGLLAVRVPLGIGIWHEGLPIEGWFEVAPGVGILPETRAVCDVAVGARFYVPGTAHPPQSKSAGSSTTESSATSQ